MVTVKRNVIDLALKVTSFGIEASKRTVVFDKDIATSRREHRVRARNSWTRVQSGGVGSCLNGNGSVRYEGDSNWSGVG